MTPAAEGNLRHKKVSFSIEGRTISGTVITHIRDGRWIIESPRLPKQYARGAGYWAVRRIVLPRDSFTVTD